MMRSFKLNFFIGLLLIFLFFPKLCFTRDSTISVRFKEKIENSRVYQLIQEKLLFLKEKLKQFNEKTIFPAFQKTKEWVNENVWQKIETFSKKEELEKKKVIFEEELKKEKEELGQEISKTKKSLWEKLKELMKKR